MIYAIKDRMGEVDWAKLQPGDRVEIAGRAGGQPYREKVVFSAVGAKGNPIAIIGVPGPDGKLPVIDGENATTDKQFSIASREYVEDFGLFTFFRLAGGSGRPAHVRIENIEFRNAGWRGLKTASKTDVTPAPTYTSFDGITRSWGQAAAGIYCVEGDDVTVKGCVFNGCNNGLIVIGHDNRDWVTEGNRYTNNGVIGSDRQHSSYVESMNETYLSNSYEPLRAGALGGALKSRGTNVLVRGNRITGGARYIDLSCPDNSINTAKLDPGYLTAVVENNTLVAKSNESGTFLYYEDRPVAGADRYTVAVRNNTFVNVRNQTDYWRVVVLKTEASVGPVANFSGNIIASLPTTPGATPSQLSLLDSVGDLRLGKNWVTNGTVKTRDNTPSPNAVVTGWESLIFGADPLFNTDWSLAANSPAKGFGAGSTPVPVPVPPVPPVPPLPPVPPVPPVPVPVPVPPVPPVPVPTPLTPVPVEQVTVIGGYKYTLRVEKVSP